MGHKRTPSGDALWEWQLPLGLAVAGLVVLLVRAFLNVDSGGVGRGFLGIALILVLYVPLTVAAMYIVAALLGISYGYLNTAILKLAAITLFTLALNQIGEAMGWPWAGWLLAIAATYFLFSQCFYLDAIETIKSVVLISIVRSLLGMLVGAILGAAAAGVAGGTP